MRIVISSPPRSGNHWIKCLLGATYGLKWIGPGRQPGHDPEEIRACAARGAFHDDSIYFQHCRFSPQLCDALDAVPARSVTIVRDPYDVFVSLHAWVQERAAREHSRQRPHKRDVLVGKPLDHPDVLAYAAEHFAANLTRANDWLHSGRAVVVRYEGLHRDPAAELARATDQIRPVERERIEAAIGACRAENMRLMKEKFAWQVRAARVGDSRERLGDPLLAVFRERHGDLVRSLGYDVR